MHHTDEILILTRGCTAAPLDPFNSSHLLL